MRVIHLLTIVSVTLFLAAAPVGGADLSKPTNTVNNVRQADPPKVSNTPKPSPVGQPISDYKPKGPSVKPKEPPPPQVQPKKN